MEQSAPPVPVVPGDVLAGKYRVERVLGRGGMGVVVAARHKDLGELFAIKLLLPQAAVDPQAVDRFLREARAAARLKGEHVAKVTDVGRLEDGSPYIVMEHLSGTDLRRHVRAGGPLAVSEAVSHMLQACDAISEAHALGIVHRDLKPSNLFLIRRANGTSCVKVLDFGISKQMAHDAVEITKTGEILGTPLYMAPEQMARMKSADARCDVWSMGIVLYELLTGTTPFHSTMITEVIARVLQEEAAPPSQLRPDLPAAIDAIVMKCLQKRPDQRFQTIGEFAAALRAASEPSAIGMVRLPSSPDLPYVSAASALSLPSAPGTLDLSSSQLPTTRLSGAGAAVQTPVANTGSAWGATGHLRPAKSSGLIPALAFVGALALGVLVFGVWLAVRAPPDAASDSSPAMNAAQAMTSAAAAGATAGVSVSPALAEVPVPPATAPASAVAPASAAVSAPATASATATAAAPTAKPAASATSRATVKKPPDAPTFGGGIR